MEPYKKLSGSSGVIAFELGKGSIKVKFADGVYLYTNASAGAKHIRNMQQLAIDGKGLSTYISQYVRDRYESKSTA